MITLNLESVCLVDELEQELQLFETFVLSMLLCYKRNLLELPFYLSLILILSLHYLTGFPDLI